MQDELSAFLQHYEDASNSCDFDNVAPLIAEWVKQKDGACVEMTSGGRVKT